MFERFVRFFAAVVWLYYIGADFVGSGVAWPALIFGCSVVRLLIRLLYVRAVRAVFCCCSVVVLYWCAKLFSIMLRLAPLRVAVVLWCLLYCGALMPCDLACGHLVFCFGVMYLLCWCVVLAQQMACCIVFCCIVLTQMRFGVSCGCLACVLCYVGLRSDLFCVVLCRAVSCAMWYVASGELPRGLLRCVALRCVVLRPS